MLSSNQKIQVTYDLLEPINEPDKSYGWMVLDNLFEELKLHDFMKKVKSKSTYDLSTALKLFIFQRILNSDSKIATVKSQVELFGDWDIHLNTIYRYLDKFDEIKNDIHLHREISRLTNREGRLVFYDVTNYYFETDISDEEAITENGEIIQAGLRRRGPSKERCHKPIVQLGLFMDTNGIPINYKLFHGNQTDPVTYLPAAEDGKTVLN